MRGHAAVVALLLTAGLAGCLGTDDPDTTPTSSASEDLDLLSEPMYDILPVEVVEIPASSDGKLMHTAVYRPDTNETVPVFVNFSPYWGDTADERGDAFAQYMIERYVPRGYAVVLAAIRGTGHSEGCFQIAGDKEIADMHDVIDHFATVEWSNGKIAAGGKSYDSTPQNGLVAKMPHPALEGLFHVSGITDMYRYTYRHGVAYTHGPIFNTYYYGQSTHEYGLPAPLVGGSPPDAASPDDESPGSLARAIDDAACPELPEMQAHGVGSGVHGMKTDYWTERDWNRDIADSDWNGSIFFVHGLQDWNVKPDHILPWLSKLPDQVHVKGWLHQDTQDDTGHVYPMRADWNDTMLRWLDHTLKGKTTGIEHTVEVEASDDVWRRSETWPPASANQTTFDVDLEDTSTPTDRANATGTVLEADQAPTRYAGQPRLTVTATSQTSDPVLTATLYEEDENGTLTWVNDAVLRGIYRDGLETPEPVTPGEPVTYELAFYPQDDVLDPGHAWVLTVGEMPRYGIPTSAQVDAVTYDLDSAELTLPLAPTDPVLDPQPTDVPCFTC